MKKILVIGSGGAGKSTVSRRLSEILGIEVFHLDKLYWHSGWVETPKPEWRKMVDELLSREAWIMDGNYSGTLDARLAACDTVIFLDLARTLCLWRVLKRVVSYRRGGRPDMAEGCDERFSLEFMRWIWNYPKRTRPRILKLLEESRGEKNVFWLRTRAEVERFLNHAEGARENSAEILKERDR